MKKKWIAIIGLAILLLLGLVCCALKNAGEEPAPTQPPKAEAETLPTEVATEPTQALQEPEWETGIVRASLAEAVYHSYDQYDEITVVGAYGDYYIVQGDVYDLLVEKRYVRLSDEDDFNETIFYAKTGADVYETVYMRDEAVATLTQNTKVTALEGKEDWVYVSWDGGEGYMLRNGLNTNPVTYAPKPDNGTTGENTPADIDGTDVDIGSLAAQDSGAKAVLLGAYQGPEADEALDSNAVILAQGVEGYLTVWNIDDEVKVTSCDDLQCRIWVEDDLYVTLPRYLIRMEGDDVYEAWSGYAASQAIVYEQYQLRNGSTQLTINTEVEVIDYLEAKTYNQLYDGCYVVRIDGQIGYMSADAVSASKYTAIGGGAGGNGGNAGSGNSGQTGDTWTPPAL